MRLPFILAVLLLASAAVRAQDMAVYSDALDPSWANYSWATVNFENASPVYSGTASIFVNDPTSNYEALYLHHDPFNPSAIYQNLTFWIYPTVSGSNELVVQATLPAPRKPPLTFPLLPRRSGIGSRSHFPSRRSASRITRTSTAFGFKTIPARRTHFTSTISRFPR